MFDLFAPSHIIILLAVALVVVGPKDLPKLMHMVGKWVGKARGLASEFKKSFDDMARESELDELRKEIESLRSHQAVTGLEADLNAPLETTPALTPAPASSEPDIGPEPRSGELQVTEVPRSGELQVTEAPRSGELQVTEAPRSGELQVTESAPSSHMSGAKPSVMPEAASETSRQ